MTVACSAMFLVPAWCSMGGHEASANSGSADRSKAMSTPSVRLEAVPFSELSGWDGDDHLAALKAFLVSCPRIRAAARGRGQHARPDLLPQPLLAACAAAEALPQPWTRASARTFFESRFRPHRVIHAAAGGLLTGYYEPVLMGSRQSGGRYTTPIYRRPPDLVNLVHEAQRGAAGHGLTHARQTARGIEPYATRAEIEAGALAGRGLELLYLADPVDAFFLQIQGSGLIRLAEGGEVRVQYDGKNGHPYASIGRHLIDTGALAADKVSMAALGRWLRADPERGRKVMQHNTSFVFFREFGPDESKGPLGVLSIPLVAGRSLAVDAGVHAIGTPVYVTAPSLRHPSAAMREVGFRRLMVAHDVGSAIRGPERGDIYFGSGERAGAVAGRTKHGGTFHILVPSEPAPSIVAGGEDRRSGKRVRRADQ